MKTFTCYTCYSKFKSMYSIPECCPLCLSKTWNSPESEKVSYKIYETLSNSGFPLTFAQIRKRSGINMFYTRKALIHLLRNKLVFIDNSSSNRRYFTVYNKPSKS